jgi:hypothetical protein
MKLLKVTINTDICLQETQIARMLQNVAYLLQNFQVSFVSNLSIWCEPSLRWPFFTVFISQENMCAGHDHKVSLIFLIVKEQIYILTCG